MDSYEHKSLIEAGRHETLSLKAETKKDLHKLLETGVAGETYDELIGDMIMVYLSESPEVLTALDKNATEKENEYFRQKIAKFQSPVSKTLEERRRQKKKRKEAST